MASGQAAAPFLRHYTLAMHAIFTASRGCATAAVALACLLALPAHAQWKWRDANGRVTVSDRPPPRDVADKDILQRPAAPRPALVSVAASAAASAASATAAASAPVDKELEARRRAAEQERLAKSKAEDDKIAAQRADNCKRARASLAGLETGQRMTRYNEKGEREVLDDNARASETRRAREAILSECKIN